MTATSSGFDWRSSEGGGSCPHRQEWCVFVHGCHCFALCLCSINIMFSKIMLKAPLRVQTSTSRPYVGINTSFCTKRRFMILSKTINLQVIFALIQPLCLQTMFFCLGDILYWGRLFFEWLNTDLSIYESISCISCALFCLFQSSSSCIASNPLLNPS